MAIGKKALDDHQYGQAIIAFRNARLFPEHAADAYNGLAIAYSHLGRTDLAERYFRQAITLAPDDARFSANLARLFSAMRPGQSSSPAIAPTVAGATGLLPSPAGDARRPASSVRAGAGVVRVEMPAGRLERVVSNEVRIARDGATTTTDPRRPSPVLAAAQPAGQMRRINPNYAVKIEIPARRQVAEVQATRYPVRISLASK